MAVRNDDADIDALLGSVVGHNGKPAEFPPEPEQAQVVPITSSRRARRAGKQRSEGQATDVDDIISKLSAELDAQIAANERERVIVDPRTVPVRFSRLREMAASALHYWQAVQDDKDDTLAMRFGRGVHALCLGTPVIRWPGKTRNGKAWEAFKRKHADKEILSTKEWDRAHGIFEAIQRHPIARDALFRESTVLEQTIEWEFLGKKCTSRPDARLGTDRLVDLKTTKCAEPRKFRQDAIWRGYHAQFSFYGRAVKEAFGAAPKESLCVAVETKKPFAITVFDLPADVLLEGEKCWRLWFERVLACESANSWPAYSEAIEHFEARPDDEVQLVIDGEEFSFDDE